ncbi:uncharacterized protein LOC120358454, partial [Solenopsis invicta]|uniref:uncharacterized protein LOC120358454 n=1 Tax=Solenopsis invicta TaxID=13686 RepID=UPI00193E3E6B
NDKAVMVSPSRTYYSPEKCRLRKRITFLKQHYKKKMRNLQQNVRRKANRITTLKCLLNTLKQKNLLNNEEADILETLDESNGKLFKQLIKQKNKCLPRKYDEQLRTFALTIHYYSPRAYEYVRSKFNSCLLHVKTIAKWYHSIEGKPGISSEALNCIKQRVKSTDYPLVGSLIFDEMAIRQHVEYDGSKFCG